MTLRDMLAYDLGAVVYNTVDFAEQIEYWDTTEAVGPVRVRALWSQSIDQGDVGYGVLTDTVDIWLIEADIVDPTGSLVPVRDTAQIVRYPDNVGTGGEETWLVYPGSVRRLPKQWGLRVFRPVYRGTMVG